MYTGGAIGIKITATAYDEAHHVFNATHAPTPDDLGGQINWLASPPRRINNAGLGWAYADRGVQREHCMAMESLMNARMRSQMNCMTGGEVIATGEYEPTVIFSPGLVSNVVGETRRLAGVMVEREQQALGPRMPEVRHAGLQRYEPPRAQGRMLPGGMLQVGPRVENNADGPPPLPDDEVGADDTNRVPGPEEA
jgi:hypothetical protein